MESTRGKVAQILDSRRIVINVGASNGVSVGMMFQVLNPKGEVIRDPDTQQVLGSVESPTAQVRIVEVQEHLSVATTTFANPTILPASLGPFAKLLMPREWIIKHETLGVGLTQVDVGDPVVQIPEVATAEQDSPSGLQTTE
jgi:hypothetical protein